MPHCVFILSVLSSIATFIFYNGKNELSLLTNICFLSRGFTFWRAVTDISALCRQCILNRIFNFNFHLFIFHLFSGCCFFSLHKEPFITEALTMSSLYLKHSLRHSSMGVCQWKQTWMLACSKAVKCVIRDVSSLGCLSLYPRWLFSFHPSSFLLIKYLTLSSNLGEMLISKWFYSFHVANTCTKIHVEISCVISSVWKTWVRMKWLHAERDLIWNTEVFH